MENPYTMTRKYFRKTPLLGAHFSIAKGLHNALREAVSYKCNTLQMFTKNATIWKERFLNDEEIKRFHQTAADSGIQKIASHTSYLINLAAVEKKKHAMACEALKQELIRSSQLSLSFVILHPGSHMGKGEEEGMAKITDSINQIFDETPDVITRLLLETTAGQGSGVGSRFDHLACIMDRVTQKHRIGICLDTCHIFAAGYDIRTKASYRKTMRQFDSIIGLNHLYLIHLNDSKRELGSRVDRHMHIGKGCIGLDAFRYLMNDKKLWNIPKIIETQKTTEGKDWDRINLERLRSLV
jgi:deoxyribonuclease-4